MINVWLIFPFAVFILAIVLAPRLIAWHERKTGMTDADDQEHEIDYP